MNSTTWIIYIAVMVAFFYFALIRPNQRRSQEQRKTQAAIQNGTRVMLSSGIFGTVRATGDRQIVVELAPGMDVTVVRAAVAQVVTADEEEFEYADELEDVDSDAEVVDRVEDDPAAGTASKASEA